jgi:hypothetical protein
MLMVYVPKKWYLPYPFSHQGKPWLDAKTPRVATAPLLWKLGIMAPIDATAASARTRASLKVPNLNSCIHDVVGRPSRTCAPSNLDVWGRALAGSFMLWQAQN